MTVLPVLIRQVLMEFPVLVVLEPVVPVVLEPVPALTGLGLVVVQVLIQALTVLVVMVLAVLYPTDLEPLLQVLVLFLPVGKVNYLSLLFHLNRLNLLLHLSLLALLTVLSVCLLKYFHLLLRHLNRYS